MTDNYKLFETFYSKVEASLNNKKKERELIRFIATYRDEYSEIFTSPYITRNTLFVDNHRESVLSILEINSNEVTKILNTIEFDGNSRKNVTPFHIILLMVIRYYILKKNKQYIYYMIALYMYSLYPTVHSKYFRKFSPDPYREETKNAYYAMVYTINKMSTQFLIKKCGSVEAGCIASVTGGIEKYTDKIKRCSDKDLEEVQKAIKNRISNMMGTHFNEYKKNYEQGNFMRPPSEAKSDDGNVRPQVSVMDIVIGLANEYVSRFFSGTVNTSMIKTCARMYEVSENELRATIMNIRASNKIDEITAFYEAVFCIYFEDNNLTDPDSIHSMKFLSYMDSVNKKGNSKDPNVIRIRELTSKWLKYSSTTYRTTTKESTLNALRKAIYMYFIIIVA